MTRRILRPGPGNYQPLMQVLDFRFITTNDNADLLKYNCPNAWSRLYEYKLVEDFLDANCPSDAKIHNSAWGFEGVHITFRNALDNKWDCIHSDIRLNDKNLPTYMYNVLTKDPKLSEKFDAVLNISTLEHLHRDGEESGPVVQSAITNLLEQVKPGGFLVCTFDYPRVDLEALEKFLNVKCKTAENILTGANSKIVNPKYSHLSVVFLTLRK